MKMTRICGVVLALSLAAVGCGDSDDGDGDGDGSNGGGSGGGAGMPGVDDCSEDNSTGGDDELPGTCTQEEFDAYVECAPAMCDAEYKELLGENYKSGTLGGTCGDYFGCVNDCDCDNACIMACTQSDACTASSTKLANCVSSKCPIPSCFTGGAGVPGGGGTCADLETCCDSLTDATAKDTCTMTLSNAMGQDAVCGAAASVFCP